MKNNLGYLVSVTDKIKLSVVDMGEEFGLEEMYDKVKCSMLDIVRLPENIDIWVDDEGLMKSGNIVLEYSINTGEGVHQLQLAGNALFMSYDSQGETIGLNGRQISWIDKNVKVVAYGEVK